MNDPPNLAMPSDADWSTRLHQDDIPIRPSKGYDTKNKAQLWKNWAFKIHKKRLAVNGIVSIEVPCISERN